MTEQPKISIRNLYKIFGTDPQSMVSKVQGGMSKAELLEKHNHVIGLQDINVDIRRGDITVIMGLSGSGKSTLIRHLNGLIKPTAGEILLDGINVAGLAGAALRELRRFRMSMVFQNFALMPHMRVLQNVEMAQRVRGDSALDAHHNAIKWLERLGLKGFENHYPHQLSGGMQQRVGIARALASNSDVMLMDEAFSALDPLMRTDMQNLLLELQEELSKTIVFITHDLDEALKIADYLVILKDGVVVQQGEPQSIILNPADAYIEKFVNDINRARVLRAESVMVPGIIVKSGTSGQVDVDDNLETVMARSQGDLSKTFVVVRDGIPAGLIKMQDVFTALVPRHALPPAAAGAIKEAQRS
ncbi:MULTISPECIES: ATP-binding cassette domain-containing protein [unclassified Mesorhizobium]|uniref:ATP-binding cassette domain-containing protein n=1 Tax=unclassified Mesorhizobium TaxID=325217 RepID=UPI000FCCAD55|nr:MULTISPECIES: ATP-binding cassette domain-containing protein [unclassified Mesorhizobium]RUW36612.1 ATP-binding cassette domain-containing protein [Mesorhizobium sp. M1E.F.Ca.ET.041.01.1.1]RUW86344.1 ATP-binding cassette domain-containing protein [Mesorhizobium sp. M1E.F.Ca.ET.063.01.1.1]RWD83340.1 MAG: ATP-binding cassette domain-containing protein [Mesorhizobium sp.]RWD91738.1 MAG: ATP-binding cassette domain-containing protein [Mesorhizobium sp.]TIV53275.1 MAG: ATP-binding cassette domai